MSGKAQKILQTALKLSQQERGEIAEQLLASLEDEPDHNVEVAWQQEIEKRIRDIDSGKVALLSWEQARQKIRETTRVAR